MRSLFCNFVKNDGAEHNSSGVEEEVEVVDFIWFCWKICCGFLNESSIICRLARGGTAFRKFVPNESRECRNARMGALKQK
jgi:hypothetical protein